MRTLLALLVSAWLAVSGLATTYYIDPAGSNAANGTSEVTAWQTVAYALTQTFVAGDVIKLKRGGSWTVGPGISGFTFPQSDMILDAYGSGARPILDGNSLTRRVVDTGTATGTITRNIHIKNGGPHSGQTTGANWLSSFGTNTIEDCTVENHATDACVDAGNDGYMIVRRCEIFGAFDDGITLHTTASALVEDCIVRNNGQGINHSGTDLSMTVNDTVFYDNAVDVDALTACTSTFNRCEFRGAADGAWTFLKGDTTGPTTFNYCTFNAAQASSVSVAEFTPQGTGALALNNCVFYGGTGANGKLSISSDTAVTVKNTIFSNWWTAATIPSGASFVAQNCTFYLVTVKATTSSSNELTTDPMFTSPTTGDFTLMEGSPAIDSALDIDLTEDLAGNVVGSTPDRGAYEFGAEPEEPSGPAGPIQINGNIIKVNGKILLLGANGEAIPFMEINATFVIE